jgi:hypothetical protein
MTTLVSKITGIWAPIELPLTELNQFGTIGLQRGGDDFVNLAWDGAILLGGLSVVAAMIARRSWRDFKGTLKQPLTPETGDMSYQRHWDFRYWHRIELVAAGLSVLCSILSLMLR